MSASAHIETVLGSVEKNHVVQFYRDDAFLGGVVGDFIARGLAAGQGIVVIATPAHRDGFLRTLRGSGADADEAMRRGQLLMLDARDTLEKFTADGMPDPGRFQTVVGGVIEAISRRYSRGVVRAYGEMVDLLWKDGRHDAAIRLEKLWNALAEAYPFSLLCAYEMRNFDRAADRDPFASVCDVHSHVVPTESYLRLEDGARLREIALLEQRAAVLEREIEQREKLETSLRDALEDARRLNRVKDEFLAVVSHELRTPLHAILGWSAMLSAKTEGEVARAAATIERNARTQIRLVEDLLDAAEIVSGRLTLQMEPFDLVRVLREALEVVAPAAAGKGVELDMGVEAESCPFVGDARRLHQIFWNLLSNAVKFTPSGGRVTMRLVGADAAVEVSVHDTGMGIRADFLPFVFDRFRQADSSRTRTFGGMGLGLAMVRHLTELHGGTVSAHSDGEGRGAVFRVTLPRRALAPADV